MNGNCHFVFGASLGTTCLLSLTQITRVFPNIDATTDSAMLFVLGGVVGGILPDMDNPVSHIGKLTTPVSTVFCALGSLTGKTGKNHRGLLHDPLLYLVGILLSYVYFTPALGLLIGCLSHIWLDMFTPSGVPVFLLGHIRLGKIVSGSTASVIFTWVSACFVIIIGIVVKFFLTL